MAKLLLLLPKIRSWEARSVAAYLMRMEAADFLDSHTLPHLF